MKHTTSGRRYAWGLVGLLAVSAGLRGLQSWGVAAPWISPDEPVYGMAARALTGSATPLSAFPSAFSSLTPLLYAAPIGLFEELATAVHAIQLVQAVLMSATGAVVFAWLRPIAGERWALVAAALTVAIPGLAYSALLMTEALFYPLVTLSLWALARTVTQPSLARQAGFLAMSVLTILTRFQGLALLVAAVVAIVVAAWLQRRARLLRECLPLLASVCLVAAGIAAAVIADVPALGAYTSSVRSGYDPWAVAGDLFEHAGGTFLVVGGAPLVALVALLPEVRGKSTNLQALVTVALTWTVVLTLQVGTFASQFVGHLAERDLMTAAPPLFGVFAAWLALGAPRRRVFTAVAAFVVAVPAILLPLGKLASPEATLDSFSTIAFRKLTDAASQDVSTWTWRF